MYSVRLSPAKIANAIRTAYSDCTCECGVSSITIAVDSLMNATAVDILQIRDELEKTLVCGIDGISEMCLDYSGTEFFVITRGSNLRKLLAHPLVDTKRLYCNDFWEVYNCLGLAVMRKMLFNDIKKVVGGVNDCHVQLLTDRMTVKGKPMPISRYTMRTNDVGALSKATYEESVEVLIAAAIQTETDHINGISSAIISGNQPRIGTGIVDLKIDYAKLFERSVMPPQPPSSSLSAITEKIQLEPIDEIPETYY
jgi:DNA-directed RNA polymerase beta' subunit